METASNTAADNFKGYQTKSWKMVFLMGVCDFFGTKNVSEPKFLLTWFSSAPTDAQFYKLEHVFVSDLVRWLNLQFKPEVTRCNVLRGNNVSFLGAHFKSTAKLSINVEALHTHATTLVWWFFSLLSAVNFSVILRLKKKLIRTQFPSLNWTTREPR